MREVEDWTNTWQREFEAERGRQWMYDGTAREVAECQGWKVLETRQSEEMVLAVAEQGELIAIGQIPRAYGFWTVQIEA